MHHILAALFTASLSVATLWTIYTNIVTICSHLHSLLPPWDEDAIAAFPTFQKWYRLLIYFLGFAGASYRSTIHPAISTQNGTQPSPITIKNGGNNH